MKDERLTEHFFLSEFIRSETATRLGIQNEPNAEQLANLRTNAQGMELVRGVLKVPVLISSGLRVEDLERILCERDYLAWCRRRSLMPSPTAWRTYFEAKKHPQGLATDFTAPAFGSPVVVCRALAASDIPFDQLIHEHTWCHVSWPRRQVAPRRQLLTLIDGGYANGIIEGVA